MLQGLLTTKNNVVHQRLGLAKQGSDITAELKMCDACLEEDCLLVPTGWWHIDHQWLPVRVCLRHQQLLRSTTIDRTRYGLRVWVLPKDFSNAPSVEFQANENQLHTLSRITLWTNFLIRRPGLNLRGNLLRHVYMLKALQRGWIAFDGTLRFGDLCKEFLDKYSGLIDLPGLGFLQDARKLNGGFLGFLLRQHNGQRHPIKHIYLMAFLFDCEEEFLEMYQSTANLVAREGEDCILRQLTRQRDQLRTLVVDNGKSVNAASSEVGVTTTTAIRFLKRSGTPYQCRPRVMTPELKRRLDEMIRRGESRDEIANVLSIRKSFIRSYLAQNKGLREVWLAANHENALLHYRQHLLKVLCENPGVPIKRIRRIPKNGFEWLYRNDRDWLESKLPGIWHRPNG